MWILVLNGLAYLTYGFVTGRFRRMLLPVTWRDILQTIRETLRFHLAHDDLTKYNAVQKLLYIGVICVGILIVISGLAIWKPVQFSELLSLLFGNFQNARLVHFLCMSAIVGFVVVHVALALLVPRTLVNMVTGGPDESTPTPRSPSRPSRNTSMIRPPSRSLFRPKNGIDQSILKENRRLIEEIDRRKRAARRRQPRRADLAHRLRRQRETARCRRCCARSRPGTTRCRRSFSGPTISRRPIRKSQVVKPPRFNAHYDVEDVKPVDGATWKLELAGRIENKKPWTLQDIYALPEQELIIQHICVEGWDYIGQWSGPNLRAFLERIGADLTAKYVAFRCADGYTESIDMPSALHPQTILATKYAKEPLADPFGFPMRLRTSTKLGFKNAKWLVAMEVTNDISGYLLPQGGLQLVQRHLGRVGQRPHQIEEQIVGVFQPDRQPQQIGRTGRALALDRGAVLDQAFDAAERGRPFPHLHVRRGRDRRRLAALEPHRQHAAEAAVHLPRRDVMAGMAGKAGIHQRRQRRMIGEPRGEQRRGARLFAHAHVERAHAAHQQPGLERPEHGAVLRPHLADARPQIALARRRRARRRRRRNGR